MLRKPTLYSSSAHSRTAQESAEARAARVPSSAPDGGNYDEDDEDSNGYDNADPNKERVGHGPWKKVIPAEEVMQIPVPVEVEKPSSKTYVSPALRYSVSLKIPSIQNQSNPNPSAAAGRKRTGRWFHWRRHASSSRRPRHHQHRVLPNAQCGASGGTAQEEKRTRLRRSTPRWPLPARPGVHDCPGGGLKPIPVARRRSQLGPAPANVAVAGHGNRFLPQCPLPSSSHPRVLRQHMQIF